MKKHYDNATDAAVAYVSHRDRTSGEVREKLASLGFSDDEIDEAVQALHDSLLLDDETYARDYVQTLLVTPHSLTVIRQKLRSHKVPEDIIELVTGELDTDYDNAYAESFSFLHNAMRGDYDINALRQKCYRRLISHGYPYDIARTAMEDAINKVRSEE